MYFSLADSAKSAIMRRAYCPRVVIFNIKLENSKINNTIVKILKEENNNNYYVLFTYNDYNFDIETTNITKQELLTLLLSILK